MHRRQDKRAGRDLAAGAAAPVTPRDRLARLRALIVLAVALPLALMAGEAVLLWNQIREQAEKELSRTADAVAEYSLRVLETQRIVAARVNDILRGLTDDDIRGRERDLHERLKSLLPELPHVQTIALSDRNAGMLLTANVFPVPRDVNIGDREWVRDLSADPQLRIHVSRVSIGRLDRNLFFGVSRRRSESGNDLPPEAFDGAINISVEPNKFAAGFAQLTDVADDTLALIREDRHVLARRPGFSEPPPPYPAGAGFAAAVASNQDRGLYRSILIVDDGKERVVAFRKVSGYPLYAVAAREVGAIRSAWLSAIVRFGAVGLPATALLALLGVIAYRRARDAQASQAALVAESARRAAAEAERAAEARFHAIFRSEPNGVLAIDRAGIIRLANPALEKQFGYGPGELIGQSVDVLVPERFRPNHPALRQGYLANPVPQYIGAGRELYGRRKDGTEFPIEIGLSAFTSGGEDFGLAIVVDITARRQSEKREKLLAAELQHRTRNLFAVVQAMAQRSLRGPALDEARDAFIARLRALARANSRLTASPGGDARLSEIVLAETEPFGDRIKAEGPEVVLSASEAQNLALALHELATNAAKYGSLSAPGGTVAIRWTVSAAERGRALSFRWSEHGGPAVRPTERRGFGTALLKATLGAGRLDYADEGLRYEVEMPLAEVAAGAPAAPASRA